MTTSSTSTAVHLQLDIYYASHRYELFAARFALAQTPPRRFVVDFLVQLVVRLPYIKTGTHLVLNSCRVISSDAILPILPINLHYKKTFWRDPLYI
jgi:hypothetical protein